MRKYHHLGVPTDKARPGEQYIEEFKVHVVPFDRNPYGIEWMRYEAGSPLPELVRKVPHLAFEVDDLARELQGQELLIAPNSPSPGVTVAFIVHDGAPIEFLQYDSPEKTT
ncbi:MAG: hypothetical protein JXO51_05200 [Candidatus Aminicenantes bacterium]|nr:hypothetical protein [Candidatus Aminicenantes bacterium]